MFNPGKYVLALSTLICIASTATADWHCRCGAIVHANYPTSCPVCGRARPNEVPPFTPPPGGNPQDTSGLRLGVVVYPANGRVVVQRALRGTPAYGKLFPNDRIVKGAFRDAYTGKKFVVDIYYPDDLRRLKSLAGAGTRVALRVYRPTAGTRDFFVSFAPRNGTVEYSLRNGQQPHAEAATISEDTSGEASSWFNDARPAQSDGRYGEAPQVRDKGPADDSASNLLDDSRS